MKRKSPDVFPDLHDFQLVALTLAPGVVSARFQLEGDVVDIAVIEPRLVHCDGDAQSMYVGDASLLMLRPEDDAAAAGFNACQVKAISDAFAGQRLAQQVLLVNGLAGIDLVLMGRQITINCSNVPYEEEPMSDEQRRRVESIQNMLSAYIAENGTEALQDGLRLGEFNKNIRGRKE